MEEDINIKLRSEILGYSLFLEQAVNNLILLNLGIFEDGNSTRLFGKKASITFKNKIDFLYDINILTKVENSDLELLMIFRNKFLHDIECNTFSSIIEQLDKGIKNRFKLYLNEGQSINQEDSCRTALQNLFIKNIRTIREKVKTKRIKTDEKNEIFQLQNKIIIYHLDLFFELINDILLTVENSELENEKVRILGDLIIEKCQSFIARYNEDEEFLSLKNKLDLFLTDIEKIKNYFGIVKIDNNNILGSMAEKDLNNRIDILKKKHP